MSLCGISTCALLAQPDSNDIRQLYESGRQLYISQQNDSAHVAFNQAKNLLEQVPHVDDKLKLAVWRSLATAKGRLGQVDSSLYWFDRGLKYIELTDQPPMERIDYLINKGVTYYYAKALDKSIPLYIEASQLCRENNYDKKHAMILNNLGIFYRQLDRYEEAVNLYNESYALRSKMNDSMGMANNLLNRATAHGYLDDHENALSDFEKAEEIYKAINSQKDIYLTTLNRGVALVELERWAEAHRILTPLYQVENIPFEKSHQVDLRLALLKINEKLNNYSEANKFVRDLESLGIPDGMYNGRSKFLKIKSELYHREGKYELAFENLSQYTKLTETHAEEVNQATLKEMETKYLSIEKDHDIDLLEADQRAKTVELKVASQRTLGLIIGLIFLAAVTAFMFYFINKIRKQNLLITKANQDKEILLREIHHRVKNNLQVISALLTLQARHLSDENAVEALKMGQNRVESMALIHKDLYQHDNLKGVNTKDYLEKLVGHLVETYNIHDDNVVVQLEIEPLWLDVDSMIPLGLMINELLSNAFKHAFDEKLGGHLYIGLVEREGSIRVIIKDNGKGITEENEFKKDSFGYSLIQSFARKLDADVTYTSDNGLKVELDVRAYKKVA